MYVDESGDRGVSLSASPIFILGALIVRDSADAAVRAFRHELCSKLRKPTGTVLHWSKNVTVHAQRKLVARELGGLGVTFSYVIVDKEPIRKTPASGLRDHSAMYNYALRRLLERVSWYVDSQHGEAILTFAHVRRFPYANLNNYLRTLRTSKTTIRWQAIRGQPRISTPEQTELLQIADLANGCLSSAIWPDPYGDVEGSYLREITDRIYARPPGHICSYGLNIVGDRNFIESQPWWPL